MEYGEGEWHRRIDQGEAMQIGIGSESREQRTAVDATA